MPAPSRSPDGARGCNEHPGSLVGAEVGGPVSRKPLTRAPRYFIPICLYPHTRYRTTVGVTALFDQFQLHLHDHLIVIADRLLVLDRLVTGRYWTVNSATLAARRDAEQIFKMINRVSHKLRAQSQGRIVFWEEIADTAEFVAFSTGLQRALMADNMLTAAFDAFVEKRVERFGLGADADKERGYELEYLLSEVCMSVYCTEMLTYWSEVWERPPTRGIPDPLKLIYEHRRGLIERLTGRPAARVLTFLNHDAELVTGSSV